MKKNNEVIKGYKVFDKNWECRGFQYEVGETYKMEDLPDACYVGFHFCLRVVDCFNYYEFNPENKVAEVIATGEINGHEDKIATNELHIVRELLWHEVLTIVNSGKANNGMLNTGNRNTGDCNSGKNNRGDQNSGDQNSGDRNSGDRNSGNRNSGHNNGGCRNSGYCNDGDYNTGNYNDGDYNSGSHNDGDYNSRSHNDGDYNSGNYNSGNGNTGSNNSGNYNSGYNNDGDCNSGQWNQGDHCTGDFNLSSHSTGCFSTEDSKIKFFDVESDMTLKEWRESDAYWTLRKLKVKKPSPIKWSRLSTKERDSIKNIPNFDSNKFFKITGIKV